VSGRNWRVRTLSKRETWEEYRRQMLIRFRNVQYYGYSTFWLEVVKTKDNLRVQKIFKWCPTCVLIDEGKQSVALLEQGMERTAHEHWDNFNNENIVQEVHRLENEHWNNVKNQYSYYRTVKDRILDEQDENSFVVLQDFSKLEPQQGDTSQDLIFAVYYYKQGDLVLSHKFFHYVAKEKNDKWFVFSAWREFIENNLFKDDQGILKQELKLFLFSDGGPKHFKLTDNLVYMGVLMWILNLKVEYNYFFAYHGMNPCDTAASQVKVLLEKWYSYPGHHRIGTMERLAEIVNGNSNNTHEPGLLNHECKAIKVYSQVNLHSSQQMKGIRGFHQIIYRIIPNGELFYLDENIFSLKIECFKLSKSLGERTNLIEEAEKTYYFDSNNFDDIPDNDTRLNGNVGLRASEHRVFINLNDFDIMREIFDNISVYLHYQNIEEPIEMNGNEENEENLTREVTFSREELLQIENIGSKDEEDEENNEMEDDEDSQDGNYSPDSVEEDD